jgi:hypothetical protein
MFRLKYKKPSSGEIRPQKKNYQINYIKPLLIIVYRLYMRPVLHSFQPNLNYEKCTLPYIYWHEQCFIAADMIIFFGALISPNYGLLFLSVNLLGLKAYSNIT